MTVFFTADTHFGHSAAIQHDGRPFKARMGLKVWRLADGHKPRE